LLLITGPCSIHDIPSTLEYMEKLKTLNARVKDEILILMRFYFEKPRTRFGWKGFLYDPYLDGSYQMNEGIKQARYLLQQALEMALGTATEFLDPNMSTYLEDGICWGCVGARTSSSPIHRQMASSLHCPIGFKNSLSGDLHTALHAIQTANLPNTFPKLINGKLVAETSNGNPFCHLIMRGSKNKPNFDIESVKNACKLLQAHHFFPHVMIDCAHGNGQKLAEKQLDVFETILPYKDEGLIFGIMLESHLNFGNQPMSDTLKYGVSITDPCLSFDQLEASILTQYSMTGFTH
ncbi:MAG: hypothetical protein K940chlam8_00571, partial [Chlamydiae bacterium]|nr:hypothetical protein [Chlamydiota bacterium]